MSQAFLQLVLLPVILVGQNVISASQDARAEADHEILTVLHTMNVRQLQMLEQQRGFWTFSRRKALEEEFATIGNIRGASS